LTITIFARTPNFMKLEVDEEGWPDASLKPRIEAAADQPDELEALAAEAERDRHFPGALLARMYLAHAFYETERGQEAHKTALRALLLAQEIGDLLAEAQLRRLLALIAWDEGRSKDGHDHVLEAMIAYEQLSRPQEIAPLMRWYGEHLGVLGALPEAEEALKEAERRFRALGDENAARACAEDLAAVKAHALRH
jgi:hypothetical protein